MRTRITRSTSEYLVEFTLANLELSKLISFKIHKHQIKKTKNTY